MTADLCPMTGKVCVVTGATDGIGKAKRSSPRSYDVSARKRLWEMSEALIESRLGKAAQKERMP
jgi:short-subunit dehydrogenase